MLLILASLLADADCGPSPLMSVIGMTFREANFEFSTNTTPYKVPTGTLLGKTYFSANVPGLLDKLHT
jgi:hypothetical protein